MAPSEQGGQGGEDEGDLDGLLEDAADRPLRAVR
jgi:hypothetical protein